MTTTKWTIDPTHSELQFKVRHLMISNVTGQFTKFEGTVETKGEDFTTAKAHFTADISSINTNNPQRDGHLQNADFFDAENHPQLVFESDKLVKKDDENYEIHGRLTMRGVTKKIVLDAEFGGITKDPWGNTRVGFTVNGKLNRMDYGVSFGMISETGGVALGEDVKVNASVQFVMEHELQPA
ncbi:MAG: YceI family protein [Saprospiraceae bacterium]